jgi:hypothetical protein
LTKLFEYLIMGPSTEKMVKREEIGAPGVLPGAPFLIIGEFAGKGKPGFLLLNT